MITRLLNKVFRRSHSAGRPPTVVGKGGHNIRHEQISQAARRTTATLQEHGYLAFVVGGAVRDLLLGVQPKDFDVATNATPEQVHALFRRSRIIGRRFRLVHVMFGGETIEVSTFRGGHDEHAGTDEHGRILRDNVWGTQEEDARRRDFTVNALFFDPQREEVWDWHGGVADLKARRLRMIGDPVKRYREDPVRMLRAARLSAKLGLAIDRATRAPIRDLASLLRNVPEARLFDELVKLLMSGQAEQCLRALHAEGLDRDLLPQLDGALRDAVSERFIMAALANTDQRIREDKPVSPTFLLAALLWPRVLTGWKAAEARGEKPVPALLEAMDAALGSQAKVLPIPRRFDAGMKEIWLLQPRFLQRNGQRPFRLLENPRFRAAYDFFRLRAEAGETELAVADWWEDFQHANPVDREALLVSEPTGSASPRRRRRRRGPRRDGPAAAGEGAA
jgi:poly(A) polymerase